MRYMRKYELELFMEGGTFVPENRSEKGVFASLEYMPEVAEDERVLNDIAADELYGGPYMTLDELGGLSGSITSCDDGWYEECRFDPDWPVAIFGKNRIRGILNQEEGRGEAIVALLAENPGFIAAVYAMTRRRHELAACLPGMIAGLVGIFGRQRVINSLASQNFDIGGNHSALYQLRRFAEEELRLQATNPNVRGVACGIVHALGLDKAPKHTVRVAA